MSMAGKKKTDKTKDVINKALAVLLALACLAVCAVLFMMFLRSEVFPREVRVLVLICDVLMGIAILWLLRHYLIYYDGKDN